MIGGFRINKGEKIKSKYKVGESAGHDIHLPFIVINGESEGPTLCVLGGVHSLECTSIEAILQLENMISVNMLKGTLILIPVVNVEGFSRRTPYYNDIDYLNQNKVFPGDPLGSITQRVAYMVFKEFVSKADFLVDAHSADLGEDGTRLVFAYKTENKELHRKMLEMASCFDVEYILLSDGEKNTGEAVKEYEIPCIETLSGAPFPLRKEDINFHKEGLLNLMRHLNMIEGKADYVTVPIDPEIKRLHSDHGGIWRKKVTPGQYVKKGEFLGEVLNLVGDTLQLVEAPSDGSVTFLRTHYSVNTGDTLLLLANV
jgi:predicted deacylase